MDDLLIQNLRHIWLIIVPQNGKDEFGIFETLFMCSITGVMKDPVRTNDPKKKAKTSRPFPFWAKSKSHIDNQHLY